MSAIGAHAFLFALFLSVGLGLILTVPSFSGRTALTPGMVSGHDILAPHHVVYTSRLLTEAEQARAEAAVEPIYTVDADIARQQVARAHQILSYIASVRRDERASAEDKARWINKIPDLVLPSTVISNVLTLDDSEWERLSAEIVSLLDRLMREGVREDRLNETRAKVPQLVSYALSAQEVEIVVAITQSLLKPNSFLDEQQTAERRRQAREAVQPVQCVIERGQAVLRAGDIVTPLHLEQLAALGLQPRELDWHSVLSKLLFVIALVATLTLYLWQTQREVLHDRKRLLLLGLIILSTGVAVKLTIPGHVLLPYFFPMSAAVMLVSVLLGVQLAIMVAVLLSLFVGFISGGSLDLTVYALLGSIFAALIVSHLERLGTFAWVALVIAVVNAVVAVSFRLFGQSYDLIALLQLIGASFANGVISSSLTFTTFFWVGTIFGITTPLQLLELVRPTHPLARRLLLEAP
ncbi:MAG: hypothetical protein ACPLRM_01970, partial [Anaerolineae bacterium]